MKSNIIKQTGKIDFTKATLLESIEFDGLIIISCPNESENAHISQFYGMCLNVGNTTYEMGHLHLFNKSKFRYFTNSIELNNAYT